TKADPLWELSSFSEAAKAVGQAQKMPAMPPPSQPRRGSTAPTVDLRHGWDYASRDNANPTNKSRSPVGAVELQRGCDSAGSGAENASNAAAFAASPGLDSSHI
ncbi:hypothetical protein, partial [Pseudomonas cedrina]|uniref:hypothetical protein n=1 Tax=Pseudomonas cedrina TaxID=651740 RepID=UPI001A9109E9